jgi:hypothetical protein
LNSILSTLSGQFGRALVMGHLLPAFLFILVLLLVVQGFVPLPGLPSEPADLLADPWGLTAVSLFSIGLAGLLYSFRLTLLRLFQGYPWKDSWLGRRQIARHRKIFDASYSRRIAMRYLRRRLKRQTAGSGPASTTDPRLAALTRRQRELSLRLNNEYSKRDLILPTRLGNLLSSVDSYPNHQYRISGASLYPRLRAVIPSSYLNAIHDAERALSFMLNGSLLCGVLLTITLVGGLTVGAPLATADLALTWAFHCLAFALASRLFYLRGVARAHEWGSLVKGAFDLYRWELLSQLGYQERPSNLKAERELWKVICLQIIHGDPPPDKETGPLGDYRPVPPPGRPKTFTEPASLEITRGVAARLPGGELEIVLSVHGSPTENVVAAMAGDTLPEGMEYRWASARSRGREISPSGVSPLRFPLGDVAQGSSVEVRYRILPRTPPVSSEDLLE